MSFLRQKPADPLAGIMQGVPDGQTADDRLAPDSTPAPVNNVLQTAAPDHPRRSILSTIGQLGDVFANVGGAPAQYQSTLDAATARDNLATDHGQQVDLNKLKLATAQGDLTDANRGRTALVARAYAALKKANPDADLSGPLALLAQQNGIDQQHAEALRQTFEQQPGSAEALASFLDKPGQGGAKYGGNVIYATGPDGKLKAFQAGLGDEGGRSVLPEGYTPIDPLKFVDTGGAQVGVGTRTGETKAVLDKTVKPDTVLTTNTQRDIATANNNSREKIAGMPARAKPGTGGAGDAAAGNSEALIALDTLENGFKTLHKLNALPGDNGGVVSNVMQTLGRTGVGQYLGEQTGDPAAQQRVALQKTVNTLQQTLIKALPASATRTKFEQEILAKSLPDPTRMSLGTAQKVIGDYRAIFKRAQAAAAAEARTKGTGSTGGTLPPKLTAPGRTLVYNPKTGKIE